MRILAASKELPCKPFPSINLVVGEEEKLCNLLTPLWNENFKKSWFNCIGSADSSSKFVQKCHNLYHAAPHAKGPGFASRSKKQTFLLSERKNNAWHSPRRIGPLKSEKSNVLRWEQFSSFSDGVYHSATSKVIWPFWPSVYGSSYKTSRVSHVVGIFCGDKGSVGFYFLPKNKKMNADLYVKVLKEHMLNFFCIHGSEVFMHDNVLFHQAKKVARFLEQQ